MFLSCRHSLPACDACTGPVTRLELKPWVPQRALAQAAVIAMRQGLRPHGHLWHQFMYFLDEGDVECADVFGAWVTNDGRDRRQFLVVSYLLRHGPQARWSTDPEFWAPLTWREARTVASKMTPWEGRAFAPLPYQTDLSRWQPERRPVKGAV